MMRESNFAGRYNDRATFAAIWSRANALLNIIVIRFISATITVYIGVSTGREQVVRERSALVKRRGFILNTRHLLDRCPMRT